MNLHFLINISSDTENLYGVRFFCSFFQKSCSCDITLFHICRLDSSDASQALLEMWQGPSDKHLEGTLTVGAKRALDRARRNLEQNEAVIAHMKTKTVKERYGKVKDILAEGNRGLYDAIILGRRATYALQWLFERPADEIPLAMAHDTSLECPLWVCAEPEEGRQNVLLCVDGSANALRAADHVGYILARAKRHKVTVFHVLGSPTGNADDLLEQAAGVLRGHGVEQDRIEKKSTWALSAPGAILNEKSSGRYAAVAVGLQGVAGGTMTSLGLQGRTTSTLIKKISKAALWCCP